MKTLLSLGLTRAIIGGLIGAAIGSGLVAVWMIMQGTPPAAFVTAFTNIAANPPDRGDAVVAAAQSMASFGSFTFLLGFLAGVGAFTDFWKWARGIRTEEGHHVPEGPTWVRYFSFDLNHKIIGIQYAVVSIILMLSGGLFALIFRSELFAPGIQFLQPIDYNTLMTLHGMVMIAGILVGVGALGNYLVPLMIGAQDTAYPRLNALAFWILPVGAGVLLMSLFSGGVETGWTAYPPLAVQSRLGMQFFYLGVYIVGLSSIVGSINLIVTIFMMRAPGMGLWKMPIFVWAILATSIIQFTATQFIGLSFLMVALQRSLGMGFFDPAKGGDPVLFQHLFWFYSHPAVYVFVLPGLGVVSELLPVFARKPLFGYRWIALSSMAIAIVGYTVWAHHMFVSGMPDYLRVPFMVATLFVAVPTGVKFFSWLGTMWGGKMTFETPMLFALGAFEIFLIGGLSGPPNGIVVTDLYLTDTYWVVGHFHHTIFGGYVFPFMAAIYFWYPKITGRMYNEVLGKIHFWVMIIGFHMITISMFALGLMGMRRRVVDYGADLGYTNLHMIATVGGYLVGASVLLFVYNLWVSVKAGEKAPNNPWGARTMEWQISSPPPELNYDEVPTIVGEPYDFGVKGAPEYVRMPGKKSGTAVGSH
jgi:cytochrome c oxidase subunit 1